MAPRGSPWSPWRGRRRPWTPWTPCPLGRPLLAALVLLQLTATLAEECTQGFSVVAPEVGVPGRPTAVLVTLHGGPDAVTPVPAVTRVTPVRNVTLRLSGAGSKVYVQSTAQIQGRGIIPLHVPQDAAGLCTLQTIVECAAGSASTAASAPCPLTATADLRLLPPVRDVIVRSDRAHAAPGDTVGFWILALSHDMTLPSDVLASVSVKDPAGTKVAVWEDVPLDQGVRSFSFSLSPGASLGRWRLEVAVEDASFGADLNVSLTGPDEAWSWGWGWSWARSMAAQQQPQPQQQPASAAAARSSTADNEVAMAEEHFVELRFGNGMRRVYKPNMPFIGKVEAVSSERSVRVRIKLYDNTTAIYSQDVEISSGEATFVVPSIMADSSRIALQAELVSVEGKEIESHYVLAREDIYRWNSSSQCFLLVEGVEKTMAVGEEARVRVLSTCPCRTDLHYVVTTQGHVTYWSDQQGQQGTTLNPADGGGAACQTNITFTVDPTMAPVSRLLVYYVTASGEPVSDVTTFDVRLLDKRMSLSFEQKPSWAPGETMDVEVLAEDNSLICLVGGRVPNGGKPGPAPGASEDSGRPSSRAVDFLDAGLSLYERQCVAPGPGGGVRFHQARADPHPSGQDALNGLRRLQLDQLWLWHCINYTNRVAAEGVSLTVPEGAGQWTLWGLSLSPTSGLRFSDAATFTVFRPLGVDFRLPRSLRVGEVLEVSVKIANNLNSCVDVSALLSLKDGAHFQSSGLGFVSERLRLGPHGATSLVVRVQATAQSINNLTAEVIAHAASSCQAPAVYGAETDATARVVRFAPFRVQPEGLTRVHTESAYFCANERIMISTSENFRFDFVPAPRNREAVVLEVRAGQGARVALSDQMTPTDWMYQVVIGDADNTISWIGRGKHEYSVHLSSAKTPGILSAVKERTFWVSWEQNTVRFGRGALVGKDLLLKWRLVKKMKVNHIGFASSWGQTADFRVWNFNDEAGYSQVLHLDVPRSVVPGSERGTLLVAGGMALPGAGVGAGAGHSQTPPPPVTGGQIPEPLQDNDLTTAEDGAGLQQPLPGPGRDPADSSSLAATVSAFAPLPGLRHLPANSSSSAEYQQRVLDSLRLRLQDLVAFLHPDGSFGDHKSHGSHRNTVAVLELLTEAQAYFSVDAALVADAKRWVQSRQADDGSFASPLADLRDGAEDAGVAPPAQQAATWSATTASTSGPADPANASADALLELEQRIETTAETLVTLLEVGVETERDSEAVVRARYFLERHMFAPRGPVALAALCLALVRSRSDVAGAALARMRAASVNQEGDFSWPVQQQDPEQQPGGGRSGADWLADDALQQDSSSRRRDPLRLNVREFRASLYALLTYSYRRDLSAAEPVARYLFYRAHLLDIHPELTYLSVKAFSAFGQLARDEHRSLTVSLATSGMELTDTLELRPGSPPASLALPSLPTKVFVYATGAGCATVQGLVQYSTYLPRSSTPLLDLWAGVEDEIPPPRNSLEELEGKQPILRLKTCFRWKGARPSGVLRLDVTLFSGFELLAMNGISVDDTGNETDVHHGARGDRVWVVMNNVSSRCAVCVHFAARSSHVISGLRPAFARVYPAARSDLASETFFHTHRGSTLLTGITEDDIVTWFGRSEDAGETPMSSSFKGICECGKKCSSDAATPASRARTTPVQAVATPTAEAASSTTTTEEDLTTVDVAQSTPTTEAGASTTPPSPSSAPSSTPRPALPAHKAAAASVGRDPARTPQPVSALPDLHYEINRAHQHDANEALELQLLPDEKPHSTAKTPMPPRGRATNVAHLTSTTIRAPMRGKAAQAAQAAPASMHYHHQAAPRAEARTQLAAQPAAQAAPQPAPRPLPKPTEQPAPKPSALTTEQPAPKPSALPTEQPAPKQSALPTEQPAPQPSALPTEQPAPQPSALPTEEPPARPSPQPAARPSQRPTAQPTVRPSPAPVSQTVAPRAPAAQSVAVPQGVPVPVAVEVLPATKPSDPHSDHVASTTRTPVKHSTPIVPKQSPPQQPSRAASTATPAVVPEPTSTEASASASASPAVSKNPLKKKVPAGGVDRKKAWPVHSAAININTPVQAAGQPEHPVVPDTDATTQQPATGTQAGAHGAHGAAERNPLWGLLREVMGPENANPADAEVMPSTISEETKDEEQQDEDEAEKEKLSFD